MIRSLFFACGTFVSLCGGLLLLVDRVVLTDYAGRRLRETAGPIAEVPAASQDSPWRFVSVARDVKEVEGGREVIDPPDWGAFGLLSVGGVTLLYTLSLPGRRDDEED